MLKKAYLCFNFFLIFFTKFCFAEKAQLIEKVKNLTDHQQQVSFEATLVTSINLKVLKQLYTLFKYYKCLPFLTDKHNTEEDEPIHER